MGLLDFAVAIVVSRRSPSAGTGCIVSSNTPIANALKPTFLGIVTWGVPLTIMIHVLSLWQLPARGGSDLQDLELGVGGAGHVPADSLISGPAAFAANRLSGCASPRAERRPGRTA